MNNAAKSTVLYLLLSSCLLLCSLLLSCLLLGCFFLWSFLNLSWLFSLSILFNLSWLFSLSILFCLCRILNTCLWLDRSTCCQCICWCFWSYGIIKLSGYFLNE